MSDFRKRYHFPREDSSRSWPSNQMCKGEGADFVLKFKIETTISRYIESESLKAVLYIRPKQQVGKDWDRRIQ